METKKRTKKTIKIGDRRYGKFDLFHRAMCEVISIRPFKIRIWVMVNPDVWGPVDERETTPEEFLAWGVGEDEE